MRQEGAAGGEMGEKKSRACARRARTSAMRLRSVDAVVDDSPRRATRKDESIVRAATILADARRVRVARTTRPTV